MGAGSEESGLEFTRWGARFIDRDVEREYRAWGFDRSRRRIRRAVAIGTGLWASLVVLMLASGYPELALVAASIMTPTLAMLYIATRRGQGVFRVSLAAACAMSGLFAVLIGFGYLGTEFHATALSAIVLACFFQMSVAGRDPLLIAVAVSTYVVATIAVLMRLVALGHMRITTFAFETWVVIMALGMATTMALVADASRRRGGRQERIIERQQAALAAERARTEELLKRELSHQVAERSRDLGAVLAKSDVVLDARRMSPGECFGERYRIVAALGKGGMGVVYEVERVTDSARLALKVVGGKVSGASAARFAREVEIGARVRHPNVISIVDIGVSAGVPFLVMDLVRGGSLEAQRAQFGDVVWALPILRQIADGLTALHDAGVVHRDLKPANVLLADRVAKITDFGISRFGASDEVSVDPAADTVAPTPTSGITMLTDTGVVMGTPLYMAPEAARGAKHLDASADVFAFGIIAYEMLTGRAPFTIPAFVAAMANQPSTAPSAIDDSRVPADLGAVVVSALESEPTRRPRLLAIAQALG